MSPTPALPNTNSNQSNGRIASRSQTALKRKTHTGAVICIQIAFDASPCDIAVKYDQFMAANVPIIGISFQENFGRRTKGSKITLAQAARQKASSRPRTDSGQSAK